jgi:multiple antibiotic resistance protein
LGETFLLAFTAFLVAIDPLGLVPIHIALTRAAAPARRRAIALKGVVVGGAVLLVFALAGERALGVLGIGMPAFRIAGGLLLLAIAFEMVFERRGDRRAGSAEHVAEDQHLQDVAVFPLAIPLIAGPAAITTAILQTGRYAGDLIHEAVVVAAMLAVLALLAATLLASSVLATLLSATLVNLLSRLLGMILAALAVQHVVDGARAAFGL